jgi:tetratricopeptide (TPR) repeat protein
MRAKLMFVMAALTVHMLAQADMEKFRTATTADRMAVLALALKAYKLQHGRYPLVQSAKELEQMLDREIMSKVSTKDAWGTELRYVAFHDGDSYRLVSAGSDAHFDEALWTKQGTLARSDEDAVTENGEPVRQWDDHTKQGATPEDLARAALDPRARTLLERADALEKANDRVGALQAYVEAVRIDARAASLEAIDRYKPRGTEAANTTLAAALRQYLDLHPGNVDATRQLIDVIKPAEAEALLAPMMRAKPDDAELYAMRGKVRAGAERADDALADFNKAAELDPNNAERHYIVGVVLYEMATKGEKVSDERKKELIRRGLASLERAEALRDGYFESMVYRSLLLRAAASLETDAARQTELTQRADALREQARAIVTARRNAKSN